MYKLHIPGTHSQSLHWTTNHPEFESGSGVLIYRNSPLMLTGYNFRRMRDEFGAWLETDRPDRARSALRVGQHESLGSPVTEEDI